jgi:hypothetical protein
MLERKPGRGLFWASMVTGLLGWIYAILNQTVGRRADLAIMALFFWFVAFWTGIFWLRVKWTQTKARAQMEAWRSAGSPPGGAGSTPVSQGRSVFGRIIAGVGIAIAIAITAMLGLVAYVAVKADKPLQQQLDAAATATAKPTVKKHHKAHPKPQPVEQPTADPPQD